MITLAQAIAYTLKNSMKELGLLVFLITISGLIFASFTYFIELPYGDSGATVQCCTVFYITVQLYCRSDLNTHWDLLGGGDHDHSRLRGHRAHVRTVYLLRPLYTTFGIIDN